MPARPREIVGLLAATALLILAFTLLFGCYLSTSSQHIVASLAVSAVLTLASCARKPTAAKTVPPPPPAQAHSHSRGQSSGNPPRADRQAYMEH